MEKFCKNCGAYISENDLYCPDCGRITENRQPAKYCPNCGEELDFNEYFCRNCGTKIKEPKKEKESIIEKYKTPIIILAVILAIAIVAVGAFSSLGIGTGQEVQVDTIRFNIPDNFEENEDLKIDENDDGVIYKSGFWQGDDDYIQIDVMHTLNYVDAEEIAGDMGGEEVNMIGYDGYFNDFEDVYAFTFVKNNKLITVYTSDYDLFSEIEVI